MGDQGRLSDKVWLASLKGRRVSGQMLRKLNPTPGPVRDLINSLRPPKDQARAHVKAGQGKLQREDLEYLRDLSEALEAQATPGSTAALHLMVLLTIAGLIWAAVARVDEVTKAEARVIAESREQVISSLEGGILSEILVTDGTKVEKGQPLILLDPTRTRSSLNEGITRGGVLQASIARLRAEATGRALVFPKSVLRDAQLVQRETEAYQSRRQTLDQSVASLRRNQQMLQLEIDASTRLSEKGLYSEIELSRLKRQANEIEQQIAERQNRFRADANAELLRFEGELAQLRDGLEARRDTYERTVLRASVSGVVKNLRANTIGSAVTPGAPLLDLVPVDDQLLFEARLFPGDIAYIHPGQPVTIKLSAFDSQVFGDLKGTVDRISPDTFRDDVKATGTAAEGFYRVIVRSDQTEFKTKTRTWPILPGMTGSVEIRTGEKTVMDYLLKPMLKAREAFRER
jgi:adhesin transport system membrane fusion protein